jgi:hypothetical protein
MDNCNDADNTASGLLTDVASVLALLFEKALPSALPRVLVPVVAVIRARLKIREKAVTAPVIPRCEATFIQIPRLAAPDEAAILVLILVPDHTTTGTHS